MINFSIRNPLIVNLFFVLIVIAGVQAWFSLPQEMFPSIEKDKVRILTVFDGASPEEVEKQITLPIEEEFDGLPDIDVMTSSSSEGASNILIKLKAGTDVDDFMRDARTALDQVTDLPDEAEESKLTRLKTRFPVISVSLYGDVSHAYLYELADDIKRSMAKLPGVASVGVSGDREWELWVEVDPQVLAANGVSLTQVARALRENLKDLPGGSIKSIEGDIRLRGQGVEPVAQSMAMIAIKSNEIGGVLRLGDVARIEHRFEEAKTIGRFNGEPSVNLTVSKTAQASTIKVAQLVRDYVADLNKTLPPTVSAGIFSDLSVFVKTRLETVKSSGIVGLILVLLSLYLMLNFRVALITALGIPVSFLVAVIALFYLGNSINMVSLFAFLIALGLIVDDAIIVTENVYRHVESGEVPVNAARIGTHEVFWPVMASTATTIAAFMPMYAIGGTMGAFISVIPTVVIASLLGSSLEAFGILPSHAAEWLQIHKTTAKKRWLDWGKYLQHYMNVLRWSLHHRYLVSVSSVGLLLIVLVFAITRMPFLLFGHVDVGQFFINVEATNTYSLQDSAKLSKKLEKIVFDTVKENELDTVLTNVGVTFIDFHRVRFGSQYIQLVVDLKKKKPEGFIERFISPVVSMKFDWEGTRERPASEIINAIREQLKKVSGLQRMSVLRPQGGPAGADIEIGVVGPDVRVLQKEAHKIVRLLERISGTSDVRQDMDPGKLEFHYQLNERGKQLGLTQQQLSNAVRTGYLGQEVVYVNSGEKRIPVRLIYPDHLRYDGLSLETLVLSLDDGRKVYLSDVAHIVRQRGFNTVNRRDMQRLATVTAEVNKDVSTPDQVIEQIKASIKDLPAGYELLFLGEKKEASESIAGMKRAMIMALAVIFFVLAALFKSLLDPLVVMFAIPFGLIGVIIGHVIFGYPIQFLSLVGFLALTGIVVNDSLILVDFARRLRLEGWNRVDAMVESGRVRIRPILLTSITTFLGISPLIFFATGQTAFLSPMAVSLGFGLLFATFLILLSLPCFYLIADDLRHWSIHQWHRLTGAKDQKDEQAPLCRVSDHHEVTREDDF